MPKVVDHELRRRELAQAVWRVIRREGVERASVRSVAAEAGWSPGALRHYFATQSELLAFAMRLVVERVERRVAELPPSGDPREAVEARLRQLLPLDDERRAENEVWLAFTGRALTDDELKGLHDEVHEALHEACAAAVGTLRAPGADGLDLSLEADRLQALIDGLAVHAALRPKRLPAERLAAILAHHLDELEGRGPRSR